MKKNEEGGACMLDFSYENKTKIIFGKTALDNLTDEIIKWGNKVLVVYGGGSIKKNGIYDRIVDQLPKNKIYFKELSGVQPNPRLDLVEEGIEIARNANIDIILAVGGGSVIDTAKAIAMGVKCSKGVWDCFNKGVIENEILPVGAIVTLPAAGSESSTATVISNEEEGVKKLFMSEALRPKFAILNPECTYTLPKKQTIAGIVDIMVHVFERYFTSTENVDLTDRLCEGVLKSIIKNTGIVLDKPYNYEARAEIMWANTIANNDILGTGRMSDWATHGIANPISAIYDVTHGYSLSIIFPAWAKYVYRNKINRFAQYANRVWNIEIDLNNLELTALEGIQRTEDFFRELGAPVRLKDIGIDERNFEIMSRRCVENGPIGSFVTLEYQDIKEIYYNAL